MSTPDASGIAGVRFRIDPDRAESVIAALEDAADRTLALRDHARKLADVTPAGADAVSVYAAQQMGRWADNGTSSLVQALDAYEQRLRDAARGYRQQLDASVQTDERNAVANRSIGTMGSS